MIYEIIVLFVIGFSNVDAATYYVATNGNNNNPGTETQPWRTVQKAANTLNAGDTVFIKGGMYNEVVSMQRSGTSIDPITIKNYPGQTPVIDGAGMGSRDGTFEVENCSHVRIEGLKVQNTDSIYQSGIWLWNADYIRVERCYSYNTKSSGIKVSWSSNVVLSENEIEQCCQSGGEENISIKLVSHDVEVSHNYIHNTAKEGIDVKEGSYNVLVLGNYIHDVVSQGLYTDSWNRHTYNVEFVSNIIHDCGFGIGACAEQGGLLENISFVNNLVYDCEGPGMFVADWGGATPHPIQDVYYINNTIHNCGNGWGGGMFFDTSEASNIVVKNNIFSQMGWMAIIVNKEPISKTIEYNLSNTLNGCQPGWCILGNAQYVNSASGDFHLLLWSPGIDWGYNSAVMGSNDLDGRDRFVDGDCNSTEIVDMGAYEFTSAYYGDFDGECDIDFIDYAILANYWLTDEFLVDIAPTPTGDGIIDKRDLKILCDNWLSDVEP